jgi:hypothetical protein
MKTLHANDLDSCFKCGNIEEDIGRKLLQCKKCKVATYCGKVSKIQTSRLTCVHGY